MKLYTFVKYSSGFSGRSFFQGIADNNPFGICQRICDLNPENCGYCSEPLQSDQWIDFWDLIEQDYAELIKRDFERIEKKIAALDRLIERYSSDLASLADRMEAFADSPGPTLHAIRNDYSVTAEALLEAKAERNQLLGLPLTDAQKKVVRRLGH